MNDLGHLALGLVLAVVTFGHLLKEPLYKFHTHVIPRLALLLFILMLPREDDRFSVDHLLAQRNDRGVGELCRVFTASTT